VGKRNGSVWEKILNKKVERFKRLKRLKRLGKVEKVGKGCGALG
jgi:hypothetical protein